MASQSKSDAARANGSKSKGPVTPEGKARSSQNARKHGLCASFQTLAAEEQHGFDELLADHEDLFQPEGAVECDLVRTLAILRWRLRRIPDIETAMLDTEISLADDEINDRFTSIDDIGRLGFVFRQLSDQSQILQLLIRYESSLTRVYDRTFKHLQKLRNEPNPRGARTPACRVETPLDAPPASSPTSIPETPAPPCIGPGFPNQRCGARIFPKLRLWSRRSPDPRGVRQSCCGLFFSPRLRIRSTSSSSSIGAEGFRRACP